jgi:hypothetical protein
MVAVVQYDKYLYALIIKAASQDADTGEMTGGSSAWSLVCRCREEVNAAGKTVTVGDGTAKVFNSLLQLPAGTQRIDDGVQVVVASKEINTDSLSNPSFIEQSKASGVVAAMGNVLRFKDGALHCRAWI